MNTQELQELLNKLTALTSVDNITINQCISNTDNETDACMLYVATCCISNAISYSMKADEITSDYVYDMIDNCSIQFDVYDLLSYDEIDSIIDVTKHAIYEDLANDFDYKLLESSIIDSLRADGVILDGFTVDPEFSCSVTGKDSVVGEMLDLVTQTIKEGLQVTIKNLQYMNDGGYTYLTDDFIELVFKDYDMRNITLYMNRYTGSIDVRGGLDYEFNGEIVNAVDRGEVEKIIYKNDEWTII